MRNDKFSKDYRGNEKVTIEMVRTGVEDGWRGEGE